MVAAGQALTKPMGLGMKLKQVATAPPRAQTQTGSPSRLEVAVARALARRQAHREGGPSPLQRKRC